MLFDPFVPEAGVLQARRRTFAARRRHEHRVVAVVAACSPAASTRFARSPVDSTRGDPEPVQASGQARSTRIGRVVTRSVYGQRDAAVGALERVAALPA